MRLFVGIELPETIRRALGLLRGGIRGAKWQRDDQFHLTLRFIGEVPPSHVDEIVGALAGISFSPFALRLSGVGLFGNGHQPRLLWAGVKDAAPLRHLARKVNHALERIGIEEEHRKFAPHVTIARFARRAGPVDEWIGQHRDFSLPPFPVSHFSLFESHLLGEGARYEIEARFPASDIEVVESPFEGSEIAATEEADVDEQRP